MAFLHGGQNVMGRNVCAVVTGPSSAAGSTVNVQGHLVTLHTGKCNPLMMGGGPWMHKHPKDFETSSGETVHWDGNVWSI
mmetsp:Transcript_11356/g.26435  ORF Transcript_11356/g.26435 Transcript_11356/m.26435 type:complete len:80 (+) Transcript_11356:123-362(+)